jgi:cation transporter-like permease
VTLADALYAAMTVLLVVAGGALIYPAVRGFQVVVYRRAVLYLGSSAVLFVVGWVMTDLYYRSVVESELLNLAGMAVLTVAAAVHFVAVWLFARDFVQFDSDTVAIDADVDSGDAGGFGDE